MPKMRFSLNSVVVTDPIDWQETELTLERNQFGAIVYSATSEFEFFNDGYTTLNNLFENDICGSVPFLLECEENDTYLDAIEGTIYGPNIITDLDNQRTKAKVLEDGYYALIEKNSSINVYIGVGRSKNDVSYTGATKKTITLYDPASGGNMASGTEAYTVEDAMEDIVSFMTDDTIGFTNNVTELAALAICSGNAINNAGGAGDYKPAISWEDLFSNLRKLYNIGYYIDSTPNLVVDYYDNIYDTTNNQTITTAFKLNRYVDNQQLYSRVDIGSSTTQAYESATYSWPDIRYTSHKSERYHLAGNCNTASVLDLIVKNLIIDSNVFENVVQNSVAATPLEEFNNDVFLFEFDTATNVAQKYDIFNFGAAPYVYNENLTNRNRTPRFEGVIPNSLLTYLGDGNDYCEVERTATTSYGVLGVLALVDFNNKISDPNTNFDNSVGNYKYTSPEDGFYRFKITANFEDIVYATGVALAGPFEGKITINHYTSGAVLINSYSTTQGTTAGSFTIVWEPSGFYMDQTDYAQVSFQGEFVGSNPAGSSFDMVEGEFECTEAESGGGEYYTFSPSDCNMIIYEGDLPITLTEFYAIRDNPEQANTINLPDSTSKKGWFRKLNYNLNSGRASIELITNQNL